MQQGRQNQNRNRQHQQGRLNHLNQMDADAAGDVVEGKILICEVEAKVLFDPGSTHSFVSPTFAQLICVPARELDYILTVATPVGKQVVCSTFFPSRSVRIGGVIFPADLIILMMHDFDVILGMDWLAGHHASMDCFSKSITFRLDEISSGVRFQGEKRISPARFISALSAAKLLRTGCEGFLAFVSKDE